jgi:hypothetical protein
MTSSLLRFALKILRPGLLFALLLVLPGLRLSANEEAPPRPEDFAGAYGLMGREGSLLRLELPVEVFMGAERPDLGDLRIFDAAGVTAPYVIREPPEQMVTPPPKDVPFFIWKQEDEKTLLTGTDIDINTSGGVVRIRNQGRDESSAPVYLADLSGLYQSNGVDGTGGAPAELLIETADGGRFFNTPVTLHYSTDLSRWIAFDKKQTLAFYGNTGASRNTLTLPTDEGKFRYLLIRLDRNAPALEKITARFDPVPAPAGIREKTIPGKISGDRKSVAYHTGGFYPVFEIDFVLPSADSFHVTIRDRYREDENWNNRGRETIFRYHSPDGEPRKNSPLSISGQAPFWEIAISGERTFTEAPALVLRWKMRELVFLAVGKGPWTLAYGNADVGPPKESLPQLEGGDAELLPALPTGEAAYEPRLRERIQADPAFGLWILWGILILAVVVLSSLAFAIARSMKNG